MAKATKDEPDDESISFECTIPQLQSACSISGDGGARLKLDIPESEMDAVMQLMGWRGRVLRVTIEAE